MSKKLNWINIIKSSQLEVQQQMLLKPCLTIFLERMKLHQVPNNTFMVELVHLEVEVVEEKLTPHVIEQLVKFATNMVMLS